jgi:hypothetical protein
MIFLPIPAELNIPYTELSCQEILEFGRNSSNIPTNSCSLVQIVLERSVVVVQNPPSHQPRHQLLDPHLHRVRVQCQPPI